MLPSPTCPFCKNHLPYKTAALAERALLKSVLKFMRKGSTSWQNLSTFQVQDHWHVGRKKEAQA